MARGRSSLLLLPGLDGDRGLVGAVAGPVGEEIGAFELLVGRVGERAVVVERQGALGWIAGRLRQQAAYRAGAQSPSLEAFRARRPLLVRDDDPAEVAEPLDYVLSLAEAGVAEMRALIFELRPESLESEGLVAAARIDSSR